MRNINFNDPIFISPESSILESMNRMNEIKRKLLVVHDNEKFISVLSIGDIQRAILGQHELHEKIKHILRSDISVCKITDQPRDIKNQMLEKRTEYMPILDDNDNLVDLWFWEDIFGDKVKRKDIKLRLPVIIMAGGFGSRLKPLTNVLPKPLLPIDDKTIIEHIMDRFVDVGCNEFHISVNFKADLMKYYLNNLNNENYQIHFFEEDEPLGTAGSMYLLKGKINSTFFVTNCDILIEQELEELYEYHQSSQNKITIVSAIKNYKIPYGTIKTGEAGQLVQLDEKPDLLFQINTGMYILEPEVLDYIPNNQFIHITDLIERLMSEKLKVGVFPITENSWIDIGTKQEYLNLIK